MATLEASNANIETSEFDETIGKTEETSYNMVDDIVFGRTRAMWWSADHHIERGCESTSPLPHPCLDTSKMAWIHLGSSAASQERCSSISKRCLSHQRHHDYDHRLMTMIITDDGHGDKVDKKDDIDRHTQRLPSEHLRTQNSQERPIHFHNFSHARKGKRPLSRVFL